MQKVVLSREESFTAMIRTRNNNNKQDHTQVGYDDGYDTPTFPLLMLLSSALTVVQQNRSNAKD